MRRLTYSGVVWAFILPSALVGGVLGYYAGSEQARDRLTPAIQQATLSRDSYKAQLTQALSEARDERARASRNAELLAENESALRNLQGVNQHIDARLSEAEQEMQELRLFWSYRSPILTDAVRALAEGVHEIEDTFGADSSALDQATSNLYRAIDQWRRDAKSPKPRYRALRDLAEAIRRHEDGIISDAQFSDTLKASLQSMTTSEQFE